MVKINQENFLVALSLLENYEKNKSNKDLEESKKALEKVIREVEFSLRKSNSEFTEYLIGSEINFQNIFDDIEEFNFQEEVESKEKDFFSTFFTFYFITKCKTNVRFPLNLTKFFRSRLLILFHILFS